MTPARDRKRAHPNRNPADRAWRELWADLAPTADEAASLREAERHLDCARHARSLRYPLRHWGELVVRAERGYGDIEDEFTNDLSARDILERLLQAVPPNIREKVTPLVAPWGARWKAATVRVAEPQWGSIILKNDEIHYVPPSEIAWWNFRIPKAGRSFEQDQERFTFLDEE